MFTKFFNLFLLIILSTGLYGQSDVEFSVADSLEIVQSMADSSFSDSIKAPPQKKSVLDHEVQYDAVDSILFDLTKNMVYLYGEAQVTYGDITLTANQISYNFNTYSVIAIGGIDTTGNEIGRPSFKQKKEAFSAKQITYNFKSEKGYIEEVRTEVANAYVHAKVSKKQPNNNVHIKGGFFTTCDKDNPHFGFRTTRMIVIPEDKIITGPGYLTFFNKIPFPIGLPFTMIPDQNRNASGIILPRYGVSVSYNQGFYLKDGGYYWSINDYIHTKLLASIFANGSWDITSETDYTLRYKFRGNFKLHYEDYIIGDKDIESSSTSLKNSFTLNWSHIQDSKASPNSNFNTNVNFASGSGNRYNLDATDQEYINQSINSTISYKYSIPNSPFNLSLNARLSQVLVPTADNTQVSTTNDFTLPQFTFNMSRIDLPLSFLRKNKLGSKKWFEKIGANYNLNAENRIKFNQQQLDTIDLNPNNFEQYLNIRNAVKHDATLSTSFKVKTFSVSPSVRANGNWYFRHIDKYLDPNDLTEVTDTIKEFSQVWNVSGGINVTGKMYGMYSFKGDKKIKAMRHQITGSAGVNYNPGVSTQQYGYVGNDGSFVSYNPYEGSIYSPPSSRPTNIYNFKLINDLEAKVKTKNDSIQDYKKVKFINNLTLDAGFNALADSIKWSDIRMTGRFTKLFDVLDVNYNAVFDPYAYNDKAQKTNDSWLSETNRLVRIKSAGVSASFALRSKKKEKKIKPSNDAELEIQKEMEENPGMFQDLNIPWDVNFSYNINVVSSPTVTNGVLSFEENLNNTLNLRGSFTLFKIFRFSVNTGYDFVNTDWSVTTLGLYVDLHCWEMNFSLRPNGGRQSYSFSINVKSPLLKDLKIKKESSFGGGSGVF